MIPLAFIIGAGTSILISEISKRRLSKMEEGGQIKDNASMFFSKIFQSRDIAHKAHLKTDSFAAHKALNEYYDGILPLVDGLVESYQGKYGKIEIPEWQTDNKDIIPYFENLLKYVDDEKDKAFSDSSFINQIDEIKALIQETLYKLKELH